MKSIRFIAIRRVSNQSSQSANRDFFGISGATPDYEQPKPKNKLTPEELNQKYSSLLIKRDSLQNEERRVNVVFGSMRFDSDNKAKVHGQFERDNEAKVLDSITVKQTFVPDKDPVTEGILARDMAPKNTNALNITVSSKITPRTGQTSQPTLESSEPKIVRGRLTHVLKRVKAYQELGKAQADDTKLQLSGGKLDTRDIETEIIEAKVQPKPVKEKLVYHPMKDVPEENEVESDVMSEEYYEKIMDNKTAVFEFNKDLDLKYAPRSRIVTPLRADEYLHRVKTRKEKPASSFNLGKRSGDLDARIGLDSQGFRTYANIVPDWTKLPKEDLMKHIKDCIIYNNYDILAVNKPYGIASTDDNQKDALNMRTLITEIAKSMRIEKTFLAHRLDKATTGVLLFATSKAKADQLAKAFKSDQVKKTYWCITRGVPRPQEAIIDCPIREHIVGGKRRSCIFPDEVPDKFQLDKKFREARRAITEYRVLNAKKYMALVEVKTRTGVKHQIRCHLSYACKTPILGDHKYSDPGKVAPQHLPTPALRALNMRQSKVRTLPVHLHAKRVMVPNAKANGLPLFIEAPVPNFFVESLKALKLMNPDIREEVVE